MTQIIDLENSNEIVRCVGTITEGRLMNCLKEPYEVRIFSAAHPNGNITTDYSYADGKIELYTPLVFGEVAKAYDNGSWFFREQTFIKNVEAERVLTNTLRIIDTQYILKDIVINLEALGFSDDLIEWRISDTWTHLFPITVAELAVNTPLDIEIRITTDETDDNSNYRDIYFEISYRREGTE